MARFAGPVSIALLCLSLLAQLPPAMGADSTAGNPVPTITLIERNLTEKRLQVRYQIKNGSDGDIWLCEIMALNSRWEHTGVRLDQESQTLFVQRRVDLPALDLWREQKWRSGRYVRLRVGETRTETLSVGLPVWVQAVPVIARESPPLESARRLVLEIGYYEDQPPASDFHPTGPNGGTWEEAVQTPSYSNRTSSGENSVQMVLEGLTVPCSTEYLEPARIHLSPLKQIEVRFHRAPLEFFFPYAQQQGLLSPQDKRYLQSLKSFVLKDKWDLMGIAYDASEARPAAFFTERSFADLICQREDGTVVTLTVYDDRYLVTQEGQVFQCQAGLVRLRMLTPRLRSLDLRVQCAANLKDLWRSFRSYYLAGYAPRRGPGKAAAEGWVYPAAGEWCAALGVGERPCPSAGKGKCHYALNPDCRPDSPPDTVLLFETKAGWNQRGGSKLFTIENHRPRGGLVLLNDGTVKFVRTTRELKQLRWR